MLFTPYIYKVAEWRVIDGDTVDIKVDLGFKLTFDINVRLSGVNAPETKGAEKEAGILVKAFVTDWFIAHRAAMVRSIKLDKYADRVVGDFVDGNACLTSALRSANLVTPVTDDGTVTKFTDDQLRSIVRRLTVTKQE